MATDPFKKFKSSINRGVTAISLKTSSSLEKAKIKTHIESITNEIERAIVTVGETAYGIWKSGEGDPAILEEMFRQIKQKEDEIEQLNAEYESIDERDNQILGTVAEEVPGNVCPNCGEVYDAPAKFCRKCGTKMGG